MFLCMFVLLGLFVLKAFNWSYFTAKIMDTVNITVPDTEKVINYSPNYYRRLNLVLARYSKRCVHFSLLRAVTNMHMCLLDILSVYVCVCVFAGVDVLY